MPTPSSDTHRPSTVPATDDQGDTLQFRAATLEEAIALAESSLGARVRVVAANRIRRGGIGGFFASDLGVEVTVALDDETMEQALERLVADAAGAPSAALDERMRFEDRLAAQEAAATSRPTEPEPVAVTRPAASPIDPVTLLGRRFDRRDDEPSTPVNPVLAEVVAAIVAEAAEKQALAAAAADTGELPAAAAAPAAPTTPVPAAGTAAVSLATWSAPDEITPPVPAVRIVAPTVEDEPTTRPVYTAPPTMLKVEQIMAELSAITAEPVFGERSRARVARPSHREPIDTGSTDASVATSAIEEERDGAPTTDPAVAAPTAPVAGPTPKIVPTLPPRASDVARRASDAAHAARARFLTNQPPDLVAPPTAVVPAASADPVVAPVLALAAEPAPVASAATTVEAARPAPVLHLADATATVVAATDVDDPEALRVEAVIEDLAGEVDDATELDDPTEETHGGRTGAAPSQRQVELAVAATDQLIESLKREDGVKRLSVRVVLRTGDHREVEAEAEWEAS